MILIIDDDVDDFDILAEAIRTIKPSAKLKHFEDATKCLHELPTIKPRPAIILLDINMPKMSGYQFLKEFRKIRMLSAIPIVIMSTISVREQKKEFSALGVANYISKPTSWEEMRDTAEYILTLEKTFS